MEVAGELILPVLARRKRSSLEIKFDVLKVISLGVDGPTRIMYASNTSWKVLKGILEDLLKKELIVEVGGIQKRYRLTEKGKELLRKYEEIQRAMNERKGFEGSEG
ncbi:MAG: winged helix-turn-helix domain-containing protein [Thermofilaceae archaeon]